MDRRAIEDLFRPFAHIVIKRMFGGHGVFADGLMFALEAYGEIYLKTDDVSRAAFDAEGLRPFQFDNKRGTVITSFRLLPEAAHEDVDVLRRWHQLACDAAQRAAAGKKRVAQKRRTPAKSDA